MKSTVWTLAGIYNLTSTPENTTDLLFGARMLNMKQTLNWSLASSIPELPTRSGEAERQRHQLGRHRRPQGPLLSSATSAGGSCRTTLDVGTGQSKLTWQINAGVGYKFDWGSVFATWRYLDYDFKSGNALQSMNMNGPLIGVAFRVHDDRIPRSHSVS